VHKSLEIKQYLVTANLRAYMLNTRREESNTVFYSYLACSYEYDSDADAAAFGGDER